eukprot:TRINITY_DN9326_c0_g1_i1.p1 TRINITY_DN9326_c0_g1~~TRINITY_DN9326_c0_g1_i1.p1  ORF type:complete len:287 (-),score=77.29 TRINITY_DN9326_c0_g1_i1:8-868(-)
MASKQDKINQLVSMGYDPHLAEEAIRINGYVESSLAWLASNQAMVDTYNPEGYSLGGSSSGGQALGGSSSGQALGGSLSEGFGVGETVDVEPVKVLTEEEKAERLAYLQEQIKQRKIEEEAAAEKASIDAEKRRREYGKEVQSANEAFKKQQAELEEIAKRKQKEQDKLALQRVREQIEIDRLNRLGKTEPEKPPIAAEPVIVPTKTYDECVIQVRLSNGQRIESNFEIDATIAAVAEFVMQNRNDGDGAFKLMTSFPRKLYDMDSEVTLTEADLVPRGMLILQKL